jgi:hypothetical protein
MNSIRKVDKETISCSTSLSHVSSSPASMWFDPASTVQPPVQNGSASLASLPRQVAARGDIRNWQQQLLERVLQVPTAWLPARSSARDSGWCDLALKRI